MFPVLRENTGLMWFGLPLIGLHECVAISIHSFMQTPLQMCAVVFSLFPLQFYSLCFDYEERGEGCIKEASSDNHPTDKK